MAYQTGAAKNINELLSKIESFAKKLDWTFVKNTGNTLYLSNDDGKYIFHFDKKRKMLTACITTGFDNVFSSLEEQPGSSCNRSYLIQKNKTDTSDLDKGNYVSYDFFGTEKYLHIVVEIESGRFRHFGVGMLNKEGEYIGGEYAYGTWLYDGYHYYQENSHSYGVSSSSDYHRSIVRADGMGRNITPWYFIANSDDLEAISKNEYGGYFFSLGRASMRYDCDTSHPDAWSVIYSQSNFGQKLIPCPNSIIINTIDGLCRRIGTVPDRYECTMRNIYPRQILERNNERWMIIPSTSYYASNTQRRPENEKHLDNSGQQGVAYRIIE